VFDKEQYQVGFSERTDDRGSRKKGYIRRIGSDLLYYSTIVAVGLMGAAALVLVGLGIRNEVKRRRRS
jgi:hypothetical protein